MQPSRHHVVPKRAQLFGMLLFLLGLALVFASSLLLYVIFRLKAPGLAELGAYRTPLFDVKLYASTAIVLLASVTIHRALQMVRREQQAAFKRWLWITNALALAFVAVQTPAMIDLLSLDPHAGPAAAQQGISRETRLWSVLFIFVLLHALHVIGGIIYLVLVTVKAHAGKYDHEHSVGVRHAALYWHFLDVVWITMFGTFLILG